MTENENKVNHTIPESSAREDSGVLTSAADTEAYKIGRICLEKCGISCTFCCCVGRRAVNAVDCLEGNL